MLKLGKLPFTAKRSDLLFTHFRVARKLPKRPRQFGHEALLGHDWGMLGNDTAGDCVWAGACHEHMLWCAAAGVTTRFDTEDAIAAYSAVTGYIPGEDSTDNGTEVRTALDYRRATGLKDAAGNLHKIGAYLKLEPGNTDHLYEALYLFGAVGIGIEFPGSAMDQFNNKQPWAVVKGSSVEGGHYIPLVAKRSQIKCVTWGAVQAITLGFYKKYCDEAWALLSVDMLKDGKSLEGFDMPALQEALSAL